jgi:hypothetical protein
MSETELARGPFGEIGIGWVPYALAGRFYA